MNVPFIYNPHVHAGSLKPLSTHKPRRASTNNQDVDITLGGHSQILGRQYCYGARIVFTSSGICEGKENETIRVHTSRRWECLYDLRVFRPNVWVVADGPCHRYLNRDRVAKYPRYFYTPRSSYPMDRLDLCCTTHIQIPRLKSSGWVV